MMAINVTVQGLCLVSCYTPEEKAKGMVGQEGVCHHPIVTLLSDQVGGTKFPPDVIKKSSLFLSSVLNTVSADSDGLRTLQGVANLPLMNEAYVVTGSEATVVE